MKGTGVACGTHPEGPHAERTTQGRSGIPWAEKGRPIRACGSVAIRTLLEVIGGGYRPTAGLVGRFHRFGTILLQAAARALSTIAS